MISHSDVGPDEFLARQILVLAKSIAPCLSSIDDTSEEAADAVSILRRVYSNATQRGPGYIKSQRIGSASVEYGDLSSMFDSDSRAALKAVCSQWQTNAAGLSMGAFPLERPIAQIWPETY
ncbi:hypothetical protein NCPPB3778_8 [Rathayibacter phage NCPPB3778]|nr:hypothetical protein NCPPB3778_8 [Rathayibacter phage NCPPB3778]